MYQYPMGGGWEWFSTRQGTLEREFRETQTMLRAPTRPWTRVWMGEIANGLPNGHGTLTNLEPHPTYETKTVGEYKNGRPCNTFQYELREGKWVGKRAHFKNCMPAK